MCKHRILVDGFGGMGDALVCVECGLSKYPEVFPMSVIFGKRIIIPCNHPLRAEWVALANAAMARRKTMMQEL